MPLDIAIMASGSGTNAQAIMDRIAQGVLDARISLVISNNPGAGVLERAAKARVRTAVLDHRKYSDRMDFDNALAELAMDSGAEYVVLAGFMRMLGRNFLHAFPGRVLNIHPALLPSFPGTRGGADALAYGVKITGCSVHFVEEAMDSGPLIIQAAVPVNTADSLEDLMPRIHAMEHRIYPQALQWLAEGRISVDGRKVSVAPGTDPCVSRSDAWFVWPPLEKDFY